MNPVTSENFGLLIAYLLPGFVTLYAAQSFVPGLYVWLGTDSATAPTVGGFLYATLGSIAAGMFVSTVRWIVIDTLHHHTGIPIPQWEFRRYPQTMSAFDSIVEDHYRYYQFHANGLVAVTFAYITRLFVLSLDLEAKVMEGFAYLFIASILYFGSRDSLRKYYDRTSAFLGSKRK